MGEFLVPEPVRGSRSVGCLKVMLLAPLRLGRRLSRSCLPFSVILGTAVVEQSSLRLPVPDDWVGPVFLCNVFFPERGCWLGLAAMTGGSMVLSGNVG